MPLRWWLRSVLPCLAIQALWLAGVQLLSAQLDPSAAGPAAAGGITRR